MGGWIRTSEIRHMLTVSTQQFSYLDNGIASKTPNNEWRDISCGKPLGLLDRIDFAEVS